MYTLRKAPTSLRSCRSQFPKARPPPRSFEPVPRSPFGTAETIHYKIHEKLPITVTPCRVRVSAFESFAQKAPSSGMFSRRLLFTLQAFTCTSVRRIRGRRIRRLSDTRNYINNKPLDLLVLSVANAGNRPTVVIPGHFSASVPSIE